MKLRGALRSTKREVDPGVVGILLVFTEEELANLARMTCHGGPRTDQSVKVKMMDASVDTSLQCTLLDARLSRAGGGQ